MSASAVLSAAVRAGLWPVLEVEGWTVAAQREFEPPMVAVLNRPIGAGLVRAMEAAFPNSSVWLLASMGRLAEARRCFKRLLLTRIRADSPLFADAVAAGLIDPEQVEHLRSAMMQAEPVLRAMVEESLGDA